MSQKQKKSMCPPGMEPGILVYEGAWVSDYTQAACQGSALILKNTEKKT